MPGIQRSGLLALGGIALAAVLAVVGHLEVDDDLNPWSLTVSDFAVSDRGGVIDAAMVVLAAASVVLLAPLRRAGVHRPARILLLTWSGGLLVTAAIPTNEPGTAMGTEAYLHRYASVVAFLVLPAAGWLLAGPLGGRTGGWLRALALTSLVLAGAMVWSAYPGDRALIGLAERLLILTEVALLTVVAATLVRRRGIAEVAAAQVPGHRQLAEVAPGARRAREVTPARGA